MTSLEKQLLQMIDLDTRYFGKRPVESDTCSGFIQL
jgi:hypothetical protein